MENDTCIEDAVAIFEKNNALPHELYMIHYALSLSESLRVIERESFEAVERGDTYLAMQLMFGGEIKVYLNPLSDTLDELDAMVKARVQERVDYVNRATIIYNRLMIVTSILFAIISTVGTLYLLKEVRISMERVREAAQITKREEKLREIAKEESRAKTQFLARMSHEIRTPMNAVLGITEIELMKANHPRETEEAFLRIHSSSNLLLSVINDILDLSKVEAGKMEIVPVTYDTSRMIMDSVLLNLMHTGSKNIQFKLEINEDLPVSLIGDELRIKQILNNFLSNAFKYTDFGTVTLSVGKVSVKDDDKSIILTFTVSDTGQGMSAEEIAKLFESEFTRFNVTANRAVEGTGLGMTIAYQLIIKMNGKVFVRSNVGEGSTFLIEIPQKVAGDAVLGKEAAKNLENMKATMPSINTMSSLARVTMPYAKVLAVDDTESNLYVLEGYLNPYQIQLETVSSGQEAINKIAEGNVYDIIFMDHMMPAMDGIETTKIIRKMGYTHPIIALTANTIKGAQELFLSNGFTGFIAKPIAIFQLNAQLIKHLCDKQPHQVLEFAKAEASINILEMCKELQLSSNIANSFLRDAKKAIEIMQPLIKKQSLDTNELKAFAIQAHGMKSALANVGKTALSKAAQTLECAANENDFQTIFAQTPVFIKYVKAVTEEFAPTEPQTETPDSNPELLQELLQTIINSCEIYDKKTANRALKALKKETWSQKTTEIISEMEAKLLHSCFEEAVDIAKAGLEILLAAKYKASEQ